MWLGLGVVLGLLGCGGEPAADVATGSASLGWIGTVATDADTFSTLMESSGREGWVALHAHDDARATATFGADPVLRSRPAWKVATLEADLAGLSATAHHALFTAWAERGTLPPGGAAIAAWSAWCSEGDPAPWFAKVAEDAPGADLVALLKVAPEDWPEADSPATRRLAAHHAALHTDPTAGWDAPEEPVLTVEGEIPRTWFDPCFHAVATKHAESVATGGKGFPAIARSWAEPEGDGLPGVLFAPWLTASDLKADLDEGVAPATWGARSVGHLDQPVGLPGDTDDAQAAREHSRLVADALTERARALEQSADENGRALLIELRLAEQWRQQWHLAQARRALEADRPRQALAYADLGIDFSNGAGPFNPPALFAVRAHALLRQGRTREALDALHALDAHRGVRQLAEVVGDLAVLEGLDRAGDSKEN